MENITQLEGLILSRQQRDTAIGIELIFWIKTEQGPCQIVLTGQRAVFLIKQDDLQETQDIFSAKGLVFDELRLLPLMTFGQQKVVAIYSQSLKSSRRLEHALTDHGIAIFEADIKVIDRYLMERFIFGSVKVTGEIIKHGAYYTCHNPKISPAKNSASLVTVSLDIECSPEQVLYSIGLTLPDESQSCVIMVGEPQPCDNVNILWVKDELSLLLALQKWFQQHDPDIIIGWAVVNFDMRLLAERAKYHHLKLCLGRDNQALQWYAHQDNSGQGSLKLAGRVVLDGIEQLKNSSRHFESYSLESVSQSLFSEGKLITEENSKFVDKGLEIKYQYEHTPLKLAAYNLQDCLLVARIFEHAQLIEYAIQRAELTGLALDRRGASVAAFTNLYLPLLHRSGYIAPNIGDVEAQHSPGGFVMDSKPGLYDWVLVLDFKSLYPSIIRTFKIDPLGMIEGLKEPETQSIAGFRGARFSRTEHHLPNILDGLSLARESAKKANNQPFQHAIKIIMNSMYGVLGSAGCRFHDTRLASSITLRGHQIMIETGEFIEKLGYQVIYGDTDSTFVWLEGCQKLGDANEIGKMLEQRINLHWQQKLAEEFQLPSLLEIEYETCFSQFFMPTLRGSESGSKKRYAGLKTTEQGNEIIFKGLESVRSDWTELARLFQETLFEKVFAKQSVTQFIIETVSQLKAGQLDTQLVYHKRLRRRLDAYVKNVPPQVRAARFADAQNIKLGRPLRYQRQGRIAYLITINGPEPIEYVSSSIDYQHYIDKQLKPIADAILPFLPEGDNFDSLVSQQMPLF
ncbi:DNA polymerase II [Psychromonas sp. psych-6C06]|uniref:DNA polymerase II n=1 Tax=Psychromonas sp. psych-6C06 TaxID=2058089 RepID=UPI000C327303|nr:DNA polymerase II [Psychromonas sp. psych-6C06]PKF60579.1 DNA polymerase II [Psychromonas sp. psych-6C06]